MKKVILMVTCAACDTELCQCHCLRRVGRKTERRKHRRNPNNRSQLGLPLNRPRRQGAPRVGETYRFTRGLNRFLK